MSRFLINQSGKCQKRKKNHKRTVILGLTVCAALLLTACGQKTDISELDEDAIEYLENQETMDMATWMSRISETSQSRYLIASESASISMEQAEEESRAAAESESIEQSIAASIEASSIAASLAEDEEAQSSIQASIEESIQESIQESQSIEASIQASIEAERGKELGNLKQGEVRQVTMADVASIRMLFANTVVIGDSRAKGSVDSGVLTGAEVQYYGGASVGTLYDTTRSGAERMKAKALFIVGLNDLGFYGGDASLFKADLINLIATYRSINPNSQVYIQEILPVLESGRADWPMMDHRLEYNQAIIEVCQEYGYGYVSTNEYALPEYVNSLDGAHYSEQFYLLWAQAVANQMGLWEGI